LIVRERSNEQLDSATEARGPLRVIHFFCTVIHMFVALSRTWSMVGVSESASTSADFYDLRERVVCHIFSSEPGVGL
jgi:hypothetical protein